MGVHVKQLLRRSKKQGCQQKKNLKNVPGTQKDQEGPQHSLPSTCPADDESLDISALELILSPDDCDVVSVLSSGSANGYVRTRVGDVQWVSTKQKKQNDHPARTDLSTSPRHGIPKTDVAWCRSQNCSCCRPAALHPTRGTKFLRSADIVTASSIRKLPRKWYMEQTYDTQLVNDIWSNIHDVLQRAAACGTEETVRWGAGLTLCEPCGPFDEISAGSSEKKDPTTPPAPMRENSIYYQEPVRVDVLAL